MFLSSDQGVKNGRDYYSWKWLVDSLHIFQIQCRRLSQKKWVTVANSRAIARREAVEGLETILLWFILPGIFHQGDTGML